MATDDEPSHGGGGGLNRKIGPLPMWAWAVAAGALGGIVWFWKRGKGAADTGQADASAGGGDQTAPTSLVPINEGLSQSQADAILDAIKKLNGKLSDDDDDDDDKPKPKPKPWPPKPKPKPKPRPKPKTVTVVKWHPSPHTPWNSTLWGIAQHEHVKGGWQYLQKINHIHGDPKRALQPGMKIRLGE